VFVPLPIITLLVILGAALVLFVSGRVRADLVGLLVLASLALTGLVSTTEALAGFSSPAVVTVWAMFILSAGLTKTGIAHQIGLPLQRLARSGEAVLVTGLMLTAALLSALINTVTVAAIMLPPTMELARRTGRSPARLLLPLSMGCMLGGPFTGISTPPNILVTDALRAAGHAPFGLFAFTPITAVIVVVGTAFVVLVGRRLLPAGSSPARSATGGVIDESYELEEHLFTTRIRPRSPLDGRTLAESRLGSALYLTVVAIQRGHAIELGPRAGTVLRAGDTLILHGRADRLERFRGEEHLQVESADAGEVAGHVWDRLRLATARVGEGSPLTGATLAESGLRRDHHVHVLAMEGPSDAAGGGSSGLRQARLEAGSTLLLQGEEHALDAAAELGLVEDVRFGGSELADAFEGAATRVVPVRVPAGSVLADRDLAESRLGNAFGLTVVGIVREGDLLAMPSPGEVIRADDLLLLQGSDRDLEVLQGLQELEITPQSAALAAELESQEVAVTEVLLSPRTRLVGRTLADLLFRDHYGLTVLAVWREGRAYRSRLQEMPLEFGDALLVYGHRRSMAALSRDPDFLVLDREAAQAPRLEKAHIAGAIMVAVLAAALFGFVPIAIAALTGAALMVLSGALTMEEAYRAIEWKVVFLVASMLPLGAAIEHSGAAQLAASALLGSVGELGPRSLVAAFFVLTVVGTQVLLIPPSAAVVLIAPMVLSTAAALGTSPHLLMMTVAIAASSSFASPLSHPAHLLVMGPGGYRFTDYVRIGAPLTLLSLAVSVALLPVLFPP
jgi:di/tricarboxylate transporter